MLVVLYDCANAKVSLPVRFLGAGKLMSALQACDARQLFRSFSNEVCPRFKAFFDTFSDVTHTGSEADKWSRNMLAKLMARLWEHCDALPNLIGLLREAADGAWVISLNGTVVGA